MIATELENYLPAIHFTDFNVAMVAQAAFITLLVVSTAVFLLVEKIRHDRTPD